jgi:hypothetical protein
MSTSRLLYGLLSQRQGKTLSRKFHEAATEAALCAVYHEVILLDDISAMVHYNNSDDLWTFGKLIYKTGDRYCSAVARIDGIGVHEH